LHRAVPTEIDVEIRATKSKVRSGVIVLRLTAVNFGDKLFDNAKEDRYTVVNFIAKDKLGPVFLVQDLIEQSKEKYLIRLNFNHLGGALAALRDLWPIRYLRHRNVIECEDLFIIQRGDENLEIAYLLYFVTNEFWQSDLSTMLARYVKRGKTLSPHYVRMCILQIAYALSYMHKLSIVHGEVRATNILLMGQGRILLNTFTNTRVYGTSSDTHFRAPEALQKNAILSKASDMFSLGVLVYEMVTLIKKVEHATLVTKEGDGVYAEGLAQEVLRTNGDELLANLIRDLIRTNPTQRITAEQVIDRLDNTRYIKLATVWVTGKFSDVLVIHSK
jgi:serine/threonine protein kinase